MLDETTLKGRIIAETLRLAAAKPWGEVTMHDIATAAATDLVHLRREFPSKTAIVSAFGRAVDDAVLTKATKPDPAQPARDRIFDVIMTRLDVLQPYKAGLKSIRSASSADLELMRRMMASQAWMLHAAGVPTDGMTGFSRVAGLASVYTSTVDTWLADDDPGLSRTMAALDRRLKRGEQALTAVSDVVNGAWDFARGLGNVFNPRTTPSEPKPGDAAGGPATGA